MHLINFRMLILWLYPCKYLSNHAYFVICVQMLITFGLVFPIMHCPDFLSFSFCRSLSFFLSFSPLFFLFSVDLNINCCWSQQTYTGSCRWGFPYPVAHQGNGQPGHTPPPSSDQHVLAWLIDLFTTIYITLIGQREETSRMVQNNVV